MSTSATPGVIAPDVTSAVRLDAADGVMDGQFFGSQIGVSASAPVYRTTLGTTAPFSLGLTAATSALSFGSYPATTTTTLPAFSASYPSTTYFPPSASLVSYPEMSATLPMYPTTTSSVTYPTTTSSVTYPTFYSPPTVYPSVYHQSTYTTLPTTIEYPTVQYTTPALPPPVQIQYIQAPPQIQYIQSPPEIRYVQSPPEIRYIEAPAKPSNEDETLKLRELIAELEQTVRVLQEEVIVLRGREVHYKGLEEELALLRSKLAAKQELRSTTNVHETYKVKTFEIAAKLAVMDGTDDGMYNGLPIEVEGEGLYRDLVAAGRKVKVETSTASLTSSKETYKVKTFEMAEKLSKMDGTDDGLYNGLPIEVVGEGLYKELVAAGRKPAQVIQADSGRVTSVSARETYKVNTFEMAEKLSRMDGTDDGKYNGLPIEVTGQGLYSELVKARRALAGSS